MNMNMDIPAAIINLKTFVTFVFDYKTVKHKGHKGYLQGHKGLFKPDYSATSAEPQRSLRLKKDLTAKIAEFFAEDRRGFTKSLDYQLIG